MTRFVVLFKHEVEGEVRDLEFKCYLSSDLDTQAEQMKSVIDTIENGTPVYYLESDMRTSVDPEEVKSYEQS